MTVLQFPQNYKAESPNPAKESHVWTPYLAVRKRSFNFHKDML